MPRCRHTFASMTSTSDMGRHIIVGRDIGPPECDWQRAPSWPNAEVVYSNPWFQIKSREGYFSLEYGHPQVVILPLVGDQVLLVRVKRPLISDEPWELPAGGSDTGETPVMAARRELYEETGIMIDDIGRFQPLPMISEMPNRSPELLICFQVAVTVEEFSQRGEHEKEITKIKLWSKDEIKAAISSGDFYLAAPTAILARFLLQDENRER